MNMEAFPEDDVPPDSGGTPRETSSQGDEAEPQSVADLPDDEPVRPEATTPLGKADPDSEPLFAGGSEETVEVKRSEHQAEARPLREIDLSDDFAGESEDE